MVLRESIFSFVPSRYLFLISICATVWKPNGAKPTCQMWVIGKAKLNTGSSPFYRRAISAWCFWLLWSRHANLLMLWYWSEMEWPAEHSVQSSSWGIALIACEELCKGMGEQWDYTYSSKSNSAWWWNAREQLSTILISVWVSVGEKACLLDAPVESLWTSRGLNSAPREYPLQLYCLRKQTVWEQLHSIWETYSIPSLISAVNMGDSFRSQSLTMNCGLTIYSMNLLRALNSWYLPCEYFPFIHVQALSQTGNLFPALLVRPSPDKTGVGVLCNPPQLVRSLAWEVRDIFLNVSSSGLVENS